MTVPIQNEIKLTVIIPAYNAGNGLAALLNALKTQTLKPAQIVLIDSGSTDETRAIAQSRDCKIIMIDHADFDHGSARNLGAQNTAGEYIVFLTQDVLPDDENMIAELIRPMQSDLNIAVCYGRQIPYPDASPLEVFAREFNYLNHSMLKTRADLPKLGIKTFFCSNSFAAYRRSIFEKLGGFKNSVGTNEDMLFAAKAIMAGYGVYYAADAKVFHSHNYSMIEIFKRYFNGCSTLSFDRCCCNIFECKKLHRLNTHKSTGYKAL